MTKSYLNLGCGNRFHPDWENVDFVSPSPNVRAHDLKKGIPFPDNAFEVVYHSHLLEHFPRQLVSEFLKECFRVLRPRGLIRVAVPDLERIARLYLEALEKASRGEPGWRDNYEWMVIEMLDQAVREKTGGSAIEFFRRDAIPNLEFVFQRWGAEAQHALDFARHGTNKSHPLSISSKLVFVLRNPSAYVRLKLRNLLLSEEDQRALNIGRFRRQGEVHHWMYDAYSLGSLLKDIGFEDQRRCGPIESLIPKWAEFHLDTEPEGTTYKPDSLYMEAVKP